jgi:hypothetical protein
VRLAFSLLLFSLIAQAVAANDPPKVVEVPRDNPTGWTEFTASIGRPLVLDAKSAAKWGLMDDDLADLVPVEGGSKAVFSAPKAGRYKLAVAVGEDLVRIAVTVGTAPKPPSPPVPVPPDPKPPVPPAPPVDPLTTELASLYAAEPATTRKADMQSLSALYTLMVTESADATYATASQLNAKFVEARDSMLTDAKTKTTRLPGVRKRCGGEVAAVIGDNPDAPLNDASRKAVANVYERLSKCVNDAAK